MGWRYEILERINIHSRQSVVLIFFDCLVKRILLIFDIWYLKLAVPIYMQSQTDRCVSNLSCAFSYFMVVGSWCNPKIWVICQRKHFDLSSCHLLHIAVVDFSIALHLLISISLNDFHIHLLHCQIPFTNVTFQLHLIRFYF